ncbi:Putative neutral zinc metallopeptidase [Rubritalea squalenifaciens DSM 18772]|uniref:Putative neutral zinc metallopeptidase n=2 Tax=Rubritalea squalenifaciens TaxID=407226 RepID=A0A1M6IFJ8_9BACT|nr:Putative neutral zinc metallopeptidase [Rubritalea squalenifaciens DSM 18772]
MWRLIILVSAIPFIAGGLAAHLLGVRFLKRSMQTHLDVETLMKKLLLLSGHADDVVQYSTKYWSAASNLNEKQFVLDEKIRTNRDVNSLAHAAIQFGLYSLQREHSATIQWRVKVVKSGYLLPTFVILIALFTSLVGKLPVKIALAAVAASFGFITVMLWLSMPVEREAGKYAAELIEEHRLFARIREEEAVVRAIHATVWTSLIPGVLRKLIVGSPAIKSPDS